MSISAATSSSSSSSSSSLSQKRRKLNQEQGAQSLWLVRLPAEIADLWSTAHHDDVLGQATIKLLPPSTNGAAPTRQLEITLPDKRAFVVEDQHPPPSATTSNSTDKNNNNSNNNNSNSNNTGRTDATSYFAFSEHDHRGREKSFSLQGRVSKRCILRGKDPLRRPSHHNAASTVAGNGLSRLLTTEEIRERQIQQFQQQQPQDLLSEASSVSLLPGIPQLTVLNEKETALVEAELLVAFQTVSALALAELLARAKRRVPGITETLLKPMVKRLADYRLSGGKRGLWELKPEFRSITTQPSSSAPLT